MWRKTHGSPKFVTIDLGLFVQLVCLLCLMIHLIQQLGIWLKCDGPCQAPSPFCHMLGASDKVTQSEMQWATPSWSLYVNIL